MNATLFIYFLMTGAMLTVAWLCGVELGQVTARRDARRIAARRDTLTMLALADAEVASRLRHPSAR